MENIKIINEYNKLISKIESILQHDYIVANIIKEKSWYIILLHNIRNRENIYFYFTKKQYKISYNPLDAKTAFIPSKDEKLKIQGLEDLQKLLFDLK
jgi:hypothetical protein